jgi:hypothetical protein
MSEDEKKLKECFSDFGALGYDQKKIAIILNKDIKEVSEMMRGEYGEAYESGGLKFQFAIDKKLMQLAQTGDLKAIEKLEKRNLK